MTVKVADAYAHVQRLVAVVKMATVLEEYTSEEQRFIVHFCGQKDSVQRIFINRCFLFMFGKCLSCKTVHNWVANEDVKTEV
jgi:hypothetical protein